MKQYLLPLLRIRSHLSKKLVSTFYQFIQNVIELQMVNIPFTSASNLYFALQNLFQHAGDREYDASTEEEEEDGETTRLTAQPRLVSVRSKSLKLMKNSVKSLTETKCKDYNKKSYLFDGYFDEQEDCAKSNEIQLVKVKPTSVPAIE